MAKNLVYCGDQLVMYNGSTVGWETASTPVGPIEPWTWDDYVDDWDWSVDNVSRGLRTMNITSGISNSDFDTTGPNGVDKGFRFTPSGTSPGYLANTFVANFDWENDWSYAQWIYATGASITAGGMYSYQYDGINLYYSIQANGDIYAEYRIIELNSSADYSQEWSAGLSTGWHHIVTNHDTSEKTFFTYVDGVLNTDFTYIYTYNTPSAYTTTRYRFNGAGNASNDYYYYQQYFFERMLTTDEISDLYNGGEGV